MHTRKLNILKHTTIDYGKFEGESCFRTSHDRFWSPWFLVREANLSEPKPPCCYRGSGGFRCAMWTTFLSRSSSGEVRIRVPTFSVVYLSRGTPSPQKKEKGTTGEPSCRKSIFVQGTNFEWEPSLSISNPTLIHSKLGLKRQDVTRAERRLLHQAKPALGHRSVSWLTRTSLASARHEVHFEPLGMYTPYCKYPAFFQGIVSTLYKKKKKRRRMYVPWKTRFSQKYNWNKQTCILSRG